MHDVKKTMVFTQGLEVKPLGANELQLVVHNKITKWQATTTKARDEWLYDLQSLASFSRAREHS